MMTLSDFYERDIKKLSPADRLKLASLILNDMANPLANDKNIDVSNEWGAQDYEEFAAATWKQIESQSQVKSQRVLASLG